MSPNRNQNLLQNTWAPSPAQEESQVLQGTSVQQNITGGCLNVVWATKMINKNIYVTSAILLLHEKREAIFADFLGYLISLPAFTKKLRNTKLAAE